MKVWHNTFTLSSKQFICGYCGSLIASSVGFRTDNNSGWIYICTHCKEPNYFDEDRSIRIPNEKYGSEVDGVTDKDLYSLYNETRNCYQNSCYNASIMISRKIISHIAVVEGADEKKNFQYYIDYLDSKGFIPPNGKPWVDQIRIIGNEANHEISLKTQEECKKLIKFIEMLLKFIFEFPSMI